MNAMNRNYLSLTSIVFLAFALLVVSCQGQVAVQSESTPAGEIPAPDDPNAVLNQPDQFNWELFAYVNQPAPTQVEVGNNQMTNNVLWETWATDNCTFPEHPVPANPPTWDGCADVKDLQTSSQLSQAVDETEQAGALPCDETGIDPKDKHSNCEEVHRNQPAFDFIIQNKLWYTEGLAEAFKSGMNVQFPIKAIEVKANWIPLTEGMDKNQYHWNYDPDGHIWVLVGMHIMSKAVPNWTWATWEWEGNLGRCDYIGCHDAFGVNPANVDPNLQPDQPYPPGELTPELLSLFQKYGLSPELQHYRLKGSQTNFVDATGRTTLLGNSYTENGFVQTSSCITCHSSAAVDGNGATHFSFAETPPPPPPDTRRSYNGVPDPAWFYDPESEKIPLDFVWALFKAQSAKGAASTSP